MATLTFVMRVLAAILVFALALRVWRVRRSNGPVLYAFGLREALMALVMAVYVISGLTDMLGYSHVAHVIRDWAGIVWAAFNIAMIRLWLALGRPPAIA